LANCSNFNNYTHRLYFFNRLDLAIAARVIESIVKIALYWAHERVWFRINWGTKKVIPFNLWFTGLSIEKTTVIANTIYQEFQKIKIPIKKLDRKELKDITTDIDFNKQISNTKLHKICNLIQLLQKNSISTISSLTTQNIGQYQIIEEMNDNNIFICSQSNLKPYTNGNNKKLINDNIIIDISQLSVDKATKIILQYIKKIT